MIQPRNTWQLSEALADLRRPIQPSRPITVDAQPQELILDLSRTAICIVDLQNDFCHPSGWLAGIGVDITGARTAAAATAALLPTLREHELPVIWLNWGNRPDQANLPPNVTHVYDPAGQGVGIGSTSSPAGAPVLEKDSWGAELVTGLTAADEDIWVDKYRMSGFFDTPLDSVLRNLRVDTILFAGVNADQCVLATLTDAACLGYDVIMIEEAVGTTSPDFCMQATIYNVHQCFGFTVTSDDLVNALTAP